MFCTGDVGHPLDTVKTKMITQSSKYAGMGDCFRKILAEDGAQGLYAGATSPLMGAVAMNAVIFFSYGFAQRVSENDLPFLRALRLAITDSAVLQPILFLGGVPYQHLILLSHNVNVLIYFECNDSKHPVSWR